MYRLVYLGSVFLLVITFVEYDGMVDCVSSQDYGIQNATKKWPDRRWKRQIDDTDIFPIVRDYFYDSDDDGEYIGNNDYDNRPFNENYRSLCQRVRKRVELRSDIYEYRPSHYVETVCRRFSPSTLNTITGTNYNQMCLEPGFSCVQRIQTIYLTRRRYDSDCWQTAKEVIATGCDCMWLNIPIQTISGESESSSSSEEN